MKSKEHIGTVKYKKLTIKSILCEFSNISVKKYKKGLINAFKSIFGRRKEKAYEDIDENQIPEELKSLIGKV